MARKDKKEGSPAKQAPQQGAANCSGSTSNCADSGRSRSGANAGAKAGSPVVDRFSSMSEQLASLGLKLRVVLGDGNCLFRALGDQMDGHTRKHIEYRRETVKYMRENREFFEPFIEDTTTFERHVALLNEPGTHAGNDAIVAFAGSYEAVVVVHQLNTPLYHIGLHGRDKSRPPRKELHVAYHNGDHYDSIRNINDPDNMECPAFIHIPTIIKNPVAALNPASTLTTVTLTLSSSSPGSTTTAAAAVNHHGHLLGNGLGGPAGHHPQLPFVESLLTKAASADGGSIWAQNGSGRRIFGDESANMALTLPSPGSPSGVSGRACERKRRRSAIGAEARHNSGSDDVEEVRNHLDSLATTWNRSSYTSR